MLSREDNELITQTNAGTPAGNLMRRYRIPALLDVLLGAQEGRFPNHSLSPR